MSESLRDRLNEMLGKMDNKVVQAKLNAALDMLKNGKTDELARKLNKMDKNELLTKVNEFDKSKLKDMNINIEEITQRVSQSDFDKLSKLVGEHGDEIVEKLKTLLNKN